MATQATPFGCMSVVGCVSVCVLFFSSCLSFVKHTIFYVHAFGGVSGSQMYVDE